MKNRSIKYFKECKHGKKIIAEGGWWIKTAKLKIFTGMTFAEYRRYKKNMHFMNIFQFPISITDFK